MIAIRFYLHNKANRKGERPLYVSVHLDGVGRLQQAVGEVLKENQWHQVNQKLTAKHNYQKEINARLERLTLKIKQQFMEMMDDGVLPTGEDLRLILRPLRAQKMMSVGQASTVRQVYEIWKKSYLQKKNRGVNLEKAAEKDLQGYNYVRSYAQVVQALEDFKGTPNIRPKELTQRLWEEYLGFLYEEREVADSTVGTHIKGWKVIREEAGLPTDESWLKNTYARSGVQPDLTWKEILQLRDHKYELEVHQAAAHIFVINCFLGLRYQDLSSLQPIHLQEIDTPHYGTVTTIQKRQGKTGGLVLVPVPPIAQALLDQYGGVLPFKVISKSASLTKFNEYIKEAAKAAKLNRAVRTEKFSNGVIKETASVLSSEISSHIARHTAGSRMQEAAGFELAQLLLGHASSSNTARYAHRDTVKTAEEILKAWEYYTAKDKKKKASS